MNHIRRHPHPLFHLRYNHLRGEVGGMVAVCSSHPMVLQAAMEQAVTEGRPLLIEATANQVNQSGGYTGMTPAGFSAFIHRMAGSAGLPDEEIIIGADHLGPRVWKTETAAIAMAKAAELTSQCVAAGFQKIHLDTGICCADDPGTVLPPEIAAGRAATLCLAAEAAACDRRRDQDLPLYVIGDDVPPPGGGLDEIGHLTITHPDDLFSTLALYEQAFRNAG
ncbi:MAG TPA: class II D-tagatose-bisphosphate aldolase, non-catalytic subunit, partial [Desulfatirhabdiaceae bacterium]|nr:class II D-tagatose-bisphosphate aldolase, non-catalytic subunit [Desulfatirhabdiaceae bacterium]